MAAPRGRSTGEDTVTPRIEAIDQEKIYNDMLELIEEIHKKALLLESDEAVAAMLKALEGVKVHMDTAVEHLENVKEIEAQAARYEKGEKGE